MIRSPITEESQILMKVNPSRAQDIQVVRAISPLIHLVIMTHLTKAHLMTIAALLMIAHPAEGHPLMIKVLK